MKRKQLTQAKYFSLFEPPTRRVDGLAVPSNIDAYLALCKADAAETSFVGSFAGPTRELSHFLFALGSGEHCLAIIARGEKVLGDHIFDTAGSFALYDLPRPRSALKPSAAARGAKLFGKCARRKTYGPSAYELDITGRVPLNILGSLDVIHDLRFRPQNALELAHVLALPSCASLRALAVEEVNYDLPEAEELWDKPLSRLRLRAKSSAKTKLVLPPIACVDDLHVNGYDVDDFRLFSSLPELQRLFVGESRLKSLRGVGALRQLRCLHIYGGTGRKKNEALKSLAELGFLEHLEVLSLSRVEVPDLKVLGTLRKLKSLSIRGASKVTSLEPLAELTGLEVLRLENFDKVKELAPLEGLGLREVTVQYGHGKAKAYVSSKSQLEKALHKERGTSSKAAKAAATKGKARKSSTTKTKRAKRLRNVLVFRLEDYPPLEDLANVCCHLAIGGQKHRPAKEYCSYTYVMAKGRKNLRLPPPDPTLPEDADFPPGFQKGLSLILADLPASKEVMGRHGATYWLATHNSMSPSEVSTYLKDAGAKVFRPEDMGGNVLDLKARIADRRHLERSVTSETDLAFYDYIVGTKRKPPKTRPSARFLEALPHRHHDPDHWDGVDQRIVRALVSLGVTEHLFLEIGPSSWETAERIDAAWMRAVTNAGLSAAKARRLLEEWRGDHNISPDFATCLSVLRNRDKLTKRAAKGSDKKKQQTRAALLQALRVVGQATEMRFPKKKMGLT